MITNFLNKIDFFLRKNIRISKGSYNPKNEDKSGLFDDILTIEKEAIFIEKYKLESFKNNSTKINYLENLYTVELLENNLDFVFDSDLQNKNIKVLDVGSKNWFYATGMYHYFKYQSLDNEILINGVEVDGYRLYTDLNSRYDYAKYYTKNLDNTNYIVDDILNHNQKYNVITCFLPFVFKEPLLCWGLPLSLYNPDKITQKMYDLLLPDGELLITNQGLDEYNEQKEILNRLNIEYEEKDKFESLFLDYSIDHYVISVKK